MPTRLLSILMCGALAIVSPQIAQAEKSKVDGASPEIARLLSAVEQDYVISQTDEVGAIENVASDVSDAALVTRPLSDLVADVNIERPDKIKDGDLKAEHVGDIALMFAVHKDNPVKKLNKGQLKKILSGKTTNWNQLGGNDAVIILITERSDQASRSAVSHTLLEKKDIVARKREVASAVTS